MDGQHVIHLQCGTTNGLRSLCLEGLVEEMSKREMEDLCAVKRCVAPLNG